MNNRFEGQVMLITGAAQGIGARVAELAAEQGARLVLVDRSPLVQELRERLAASAEVIAIEADLECFEGALAAAEQAHAKFGRIDILVNNVGGTIWTRPYEHYEPAQIEAEVRRSLFPTLWGCRAVLPYMLEQKKGAIVNVSSIATRSVNRVPYGAAKGGVNALTACLAFENGERGIRVNAIAPGAAATHSAQHRRARQPRPGLVPADRGPDRVEHAHETLRHAGRTGQRHPVPRFR